MIKGLYSEFPGVVADDVYGQLPRDVCAFVDTDTGVVYTGHWYHGNESIPDAVRSLLAHEPKAERQARATRKMLRVK